MFKEIVRLSAFAVLLFVSSFADAQQFPSRPIVWVVPYPPGGNPDVISRYVAKGVGEKLGQAILIDNRSGASGVVGTEFAAAAKPDGYTILYSPSSVMTVLPLINKKMSFDPLKDFAPIHGLGSYDMVLITNTDRPLKDLPTLIDFAKKNPKKLNYGSAGVGTTSHLASSYFEKLAGIEMTHIPFRGAGQSVPSLLSNDIDLLFDYPAATKELIAAGKLRPLLTTGTSRMSSLPEVGTLQEAGFAGAAFSPWDVVLVPANTPRDVKGILAEAFRDVLSRPETAKFFNERGAKPLSALSDEALSKFLSAEAAKMKALVEQVAITTE